MRYSYYRVRHSEDEWNLDGQEKRDLENRYCQQYKGVLQR
jgi:hypothetical protein